MNNENLETAKQYYEGWETSNKELLKLSPALKFTSPDDSFSSADEFLNACWKHSGMEFQNKIFLSDGDNVCVKYEIAVPGGNLKHFVEWLIFERGMISEIHVFYHKTDY